jgi:peptidyl-prolyl cis-trans isomerase D
MMRQMREATKPIMLLAALAFVGLMVFQWGMDITGQSSGSFGEIGRVNGDPVIYDAYMASYRNLYDQVQRSQETPVTSQQNKEIEDAAFDEVVNQILIRQELRRRGIDVTDQEISEAAQFSPPADLRPQFTDENGRFDLNGYQTFLATLPPDQLLILEAYYRDVIPRGKLMRQVSSGIFLSDAELWQQWKDRDEKAVIRFLPLDPTTRYQDDDFEIPDTDTEAYYEEHKDEFEVPARAKIRVVVLGQAPTAADTVASGEKAAAIRQEILDGGDFAEIAQRESSDKTSAAQGGELGVFAKGRMVGAFDSAVFNGPIGRLSEPVKTSFGYHLVEVEERWGQDSAQARHILVPIERTDDSEIALLMLADSIEALAEAMPLEEAATAAGVTAVDAEITSTFPFVQGAGQISEGADWIFEEASPGDVSPVFENSEAFYAIELISSEPAGVLPLEDAKPAIESTLRFERKMERAKAEGQKVVTRVRSGEGLAEVAADLGMEIRDAGPFSRNDFVPGLGRQNAAVGAAFGLAPGQVSDVVTTPANAFVIESVDRIPADSAAWIAQKAQQRLLEIPTLQQQRVQQWVAALRASAKIVDRRDEVLQPADQDLAQLPPVF